MSARARAKLACVFLALSGCRDQQGLLPSGFEGALTRSQVSLDLLAWAEDEERTVVLDAQVSWPLYRASCLGGLQQWAWAVGDEPFASDARVYTGDPVPSLHSGPGEQSGTIIYREYWPIEGNWDLTVTPDVPVGPDGEIPNSWYEHGLEGHVDLLLTDFVFQDAADPTLVVQMARFHFIGDVWLPDV